MFKRFISEHRKSNEEKHSTADKVCMVVWNTFETDARVTKEAKSLIKLGKKVTVIAVFEPKRTKKHEEKDSINIIRIDRTILKKKELSQVPSSNSIKSNHVHHINTEKKSNPIKKRIRSILKSVYGLIPKTMINIRFFLYAMKQDATIYHAHDLNTLVPTYLVAKIKGAKIVYDAHEVSTDRAGWKNKRLWTKIESFLIRRVDHVITTNDTRAEFFSEQYNIPVPTVIRNVPPLQYVSKTDKLRKQCNISIDEPIVLYQGGIQRDRGLENIIRCIPLVPKGIFIFLGNGSLKPKIIALAKELKVEDRTRFIDAVPNEELLTYTASADIGMQLLQNTCFNHYSACSNKIHEYLMAGLPVVASDLPEIRKVVSSSHIGLIVNPDDLEMVAKSINTLINNEELYKELQGNTKEAALLHHWDIEEGKLHKIYNFLK
ncbi:glycosyltransferase [Alkalihalobacillus sp. BA299]|uniref:glycosyltransferase n=1 Tax=Alkalihalobacillus sp. BA299 TaxID=2815938 RepID=UPI001AD9E599|nr:glycosyltransferase [Alkalihalobacillus sp. BA299]